MARTAIATLHDDNDLQAHQAANISPMAEAWETLTQLQAEVSENALAVAQQIGYEGPMAIGSIEDRIRQSMRRTVSECLEIGKSLLILKELAPHGEFQNRVELLGLGYRTAAKFMSSTLKFSKVNSNSLLKAAGSQSKLLELLILDDGEIEALESGDTIRGLTLDKIETLSVSELKKALREATDRIEAKDAVIKDKSAKIDAQAEQLASLDAKQRNAPPVSAGQALLDARARLQTTSAHVKAAVMADLRKAIKDLHGIPGDHGAFAGGCLIEIGRELAILRDEYSLPQTVTEDLTPDWMKPEVMADIERQYASPYSVGDIISDSGE